MDIFSMGTRGRMVVSTGITAPVVFSQEQQEVIDAAAGERLLVLAGPGAGKTQVTAERIKRLLAQGLRPSAILVLSFSRSAVATLTHRIGQFCGRQESTLEELRHIAIRTFDSWTFRMLRQLGFGAGDILCQTHDENIENLLSLMQSGRRSEIQQLLSNVRHVLVDEMQDLAGVRGDLVVELLGLIAAPGSSGTGFTLLGDQAQSIYGFSARQSERTSLYGQTTSQLLAGLLRKWPDELREISLNRNYRAVPEIADTLETLRFVLGQDIEPDSKLKAVSEVLRGLSDADFEIDKTLFSRNGLHSVAILARRNGEVLRIIQKIFGSDVEGPGVPFFIGGVDKNSAPAWVAGLLGKVKAVTIIRSQFDAIVSKLRLDSEDAFNALSIPEPEVAWRRLVTAAGMPAESTSLVVRELTKRLTWADSFPDDQAVPISGLFVSTIHQSKGREFDLVAILDYPRKTEVGEDDPEEDACVGFVALSRAAKRLVRLPAETIYPPPTMRKFNNGTRSRLLHQRNGWVNIEIGIKGDVDPFSFVDVSLLGSEEAVADNYRFLAEGAKTLVGHKVMLRKMALPDSGGKKFRYEICVQDGAKPGRLIGAMRQNLVWDLLSVLGDSGVSLPGRVMNLRISRVVSLSDQTEGEAVVSAGFAKSGMWLGVDLMGMGDFRTKFNRKN